MVEMVDRAQGGRALTNKHREQGDDRARVEGWTMAEFMPRAICLLDGGGRIVLANGPFRELLPGDGADPVGRDLLDLLDPVEHARMTALLPQVLVRGGGTIRTLLPIAEAEDRQNLWLTFWPAEGPEDADLWVLAECPPRRLQREAELADMIHAASHDLRAPLDTIASLLKLFVDLYGEGIDPEGMEMVTMAIDRSGELARVFDSMVTFMRIGQPGAVWEEISLTDLFQTVVSQRRTEERCESLSIDGELPCVVGVARWLRRALEVLLDNAVLYVEEGRQARVAVRYVEEDGFHRISVTDQGIGIPPRYHERVFGMFQRLHEPQRYPGLGVGLALARRVAAAHAGTLTVESEEGAGAVFTLSLPADSLLSG